MLLLLLTLIGLVINMLIVALTTIANISLNSIYIILFVGGFISGIGIGNA